MRLHFGLLLLIFFKQCHSFKIKIETCITPEFNHGVCRPKEECFGVKEESLSHVGCTDKYVCCPRRTISKKKCVEYSKAVFSNEGASSMMAGNEAVERIDECGIVAIALIVGGEKAAPKEFPHMAAIGFGNTLDKVHWMCGGSLISELYVLTAAHCLENHNAGGRPKFVKMGAVNIIKEMHKFVQIRMIEKYIYHPHFKAGEKYNDIGLLRLKKKVKFTPYVRPACLDYSGKLLEKSALATGWGKISHDSQYGNPDLLKVKLNFINKKDCSRAFRFAHSIPQGLRDSQLCAGNLAGGKDTCQGDSGGPLQTIKTKPYCMYRIVGVTSFGLTCGMEWAPAIYSRVFSYLPWIENVIWPEA